MKEVTIVAYCDGNAHGEDRSRSSIERVVSVDNGRPVTLDLCDVCDVLVEQLLALMENGSTVKSGKRSHSKASSSSTVVPGARRNAPLPTTIPVEGPHICPDCQFESKSRSALGQHLSSKHGKGFRDFLVDQAS